MGKFIEFKDQEDGYWIICIDQIGAFNKHKITCEKCESPDYVIEIFDNNGHQLCSCRGSAEQVEKWDEIIRKNFMEPESYIKFEDQENGYWIICIDQIGAFNKHKITCEKCGRPDYVIEIFDNNGRQLCSCRGSNEQVATWDGIIHSNSKIIDPSDDKTNTESTPDPGKKPDVPQTTQ